ncbi:methyltransferase domain-containing protein [Acidobacteriota bacterium]
MLKPLLKFNNNKVLQMREDEHDLKLQLGSGGRMLKGWINIDSIWRPNTVVMRLPQGLRKFNNSSIEYIYSCHFLEHLRYPQEALSLLKTCYRLLKPGGAIRIGVPDIEKIIDAYVRDDKDFFSEQKRLHPDCCSTKLEHLMYALQQEGEHRYGYDFQTLNKLLKKAGFNEVFRSAYGKSKIEALNVDYRDDLEKDFHLTLYVDALKSPEKEVQ